jgi:hypothetical protein
MKSMASTTHAPSQSLADFCKDFEPLEAPNIQTLQDHRTGALYRECHVKANKLVALCTTDVPLDPEEQADYRANRQIVENAPAYRFRITSCWRWKL